jgi:hypothetical protein
MLAVAATAKKIRRAQRPGSASPRSGRVSAEGAVLGAKKRRLRRSEKLNRYFPVGDEVNGQSRLDSESLGARIRHMVNRLAVSVFLIATPDFRTDASCLPTPSTNTCRRERRKASTLVQLRRTAAQARWDRSMGDAPFWCRLRVGERARWWRRSSSTRCRDRSPRALKNSLKRRSFADPKQEASASDFDTF